LSLATAGELKIPDVQVFGHQDRLQLAFSYYDHELC
jgi:hypothetical protein